MYHSIYQLIIMGKIGTYEYPENSMSEMLEILKILGDEKIQRIDLLANRLQHKDVKSGAFLNKLTSMSRYGLLKGQIRADIITLSELAKKIIHYKDADEYTHAINEAIRNIKLFDLLYHRLGDKEPNDNFWVDLVEITGVDRELAKKEEYKVRKLYNDALQYLKPVEKAQEQIKGAIIEPKNIPEPAPEPIDRSEKKMIDHPERVEASLEDKVRPESIEEIKFGDIRIWIPKQDAKAVTTAIKLLELYEEGIKKEAPTAS